MGKCNQDFNFYVTYLLTYLLTCRGEALGQTQSHQIDVDENFMLLFA